MSLILHSFLAYPLHLPTWQRPSGSVDYRITNSFDGPDLVNGGKHGAVDVGNFRRGDTLRAPASCKARGLKHTDGALGVVFDLGGYVTLELWHLDRLLVPLSGWIDVALGQAVGATGATGAKLADGSPMPAHTHIELKLDGLRVDPQPYLPIVEVGGGVPKAIPGATATSGPFVDVASTHPLYGDVKWAWDHGITRNARFRPDEPATRAEVVAMLHRLFDLLNA